MGASSTIHTLMSVQVGQARGSVGRYFLPFRSVLSLVPHAHDSPLVCVVCLPVSLVVLCLDVNEVNPGPDREVGHTRSEGLKLNGLVRFRMR